MKPDDDDGIVFEVWKTPEEIHKISRDFYRIPVQQLDEITLRIDNHPFEIINLTPFGMSILLACSPGFSVGEMIDSIEFNLGGERYMFQGKVCHISPNDPDGYVCGIELIEPMKGKQRSFQDFIHRKLNNFLISSIIK